MPDAHDELPSWKGALGDQIRQAREAAGLTQAQLAKAVGLKHRNTIMRYEAGKDAPSVNVLGSIAATLKMAEVQINGHRFSVASQEVPGTANKTEQLVLDFGKAYVCPGAVITITPTTLNITITAIAPLPPNQAPRPEKEERQA